MMRRSEESRGVLFCGGLLDGGVDSGADTVLIVHQTGWPVSLYTPSGAVISMPHQLVGVSALDGSGGGDVSPRTAAARALRAQVTSAVSTPIPPHQEYRYLKGIKDVLLAFRDDRAFLPLLHATLASGFVSLAPSPPSPSSSSSSSSSVAATASSVSSSSKSVHTSSSAFYHHQWAQLSASQQEQLESLPLLLMTSAHVAQLQEAVEAAPMHIPIMASASATATTQRPGASSRAASALASYEQVAHAVHAWGWPATRGPPLMSECVAHVDFGAHIVRFPAFILDSNLA